MHVARTPARGAPRVLGRLPFALRQAGLVLLGVVVYFRVRGLTQGSAHLAREHAHDVVQLERALGVDAEPTCSAWSHRPRRSRRSRLDNT